MVAAPSSSVATSSAARSSGAPWWGRRSSVAPTPAGRRHPGRRPRSRRRRRRRSRPQRRGRQPPTRGGAAAVGRAARHQLRRREGRRRGEGARACRRRSRSAGAGSFAIARSTVAATRGRHVRARHGERRERARPGGRSPSPAASARRTARGRRASRTARRRRRRCPTPASARAPAVRSGDRYFGVPMNSPVVVRSADSSSSRLAMPKSASLADPSAGQQDVARLDVAVDDAGAVGGAERLQHLVGDALRPGHRQRTVGRQHGGQRRPVDQLHHEVQVIVGDPGVVDRDRMGVAEAGRRAGLAHEPRRARPGRRRPPAAA